MLVDWSLGPLGAFLGLSTSQSEEHLTAGSSSAEGDCLDPFFLFFLIFGHVSPKIPPKFLSHGTFL